MHSFTLFEYRPSSKLYLCGNAVIDSVFSTRMLRFPSRSTGRNIAISSYSSNNLISRSTTYCNLSTGPRCNGLCLPTNLYVITSAKVPLAHTGPIGP
ncbi:MAG: hypothetical protein ACXW07_07190 [Nitrososphaeraceae archaeon]